MKSNSIFGQSREQNEFLSTFSRKSETFRKNLKKRDIFEKMALIYLFIYEAYRVFRLILHIPLKIEVLLDRSVLAGTFETPEHSRLEIKKSTQNLHNQAVC